MSGPAPRMRTYGQFCGVARALDVVGDRWTLLIVRELLVGPARYGELQANLPGIATNLLADRLRELEARGIVERAADGGWGAPYRLTEFGGGLEAVVGALVRWSTPLMAVGRGDDSFRPSWLVVALRALLGTAPRGHVRVQLVVDGEPIAVVARDTSVEVTAGTLDGPTAVLEAPADLVLGIAAGAMDLVAAMARPDVRVSGSRAALDALFTHRE